MAHSVLVVPVPPLEPYVRARWEHYDPSWVSRDPVFTHAHVTALAPFLTAPGEADLAAVERIAAATPAFDFVLSDVVAFPDGIVHAPPRPAGPFADLTARLWQEFPQCPPYDGRFDVVPHLTLDRIDPAKGVDVARVRADLGGLLPAACRAERLELHWYDEGDCRVLRSWPLGR